MQTIVHLDRVSPTTNLPQKYVIEADELIAVHDKTAVHFRDKGGRTLASFQTSTIIGYYSPDSVKEG